ncbi:F-box/LRR-repeat/kelch-repeat protein At1g09650-like [Euphorbia lathyris]|uniref:F-box/LRR-repeat/kelch-repeat protein At1g09650-like n=1 Tax=Euphorbia lathyris TaxID=212925 RepID=UPI003313C1A3
MTGKRSKRRIMPSPASPAFPASPFPSNILQNILARLDVKTLMRFKLVSKTWLNLISSPGMTGKHSKRRILPSPASPASPASPFPSNILQNILARLDVKTLMRFKLVSKAWLNLISSPGMTGKHSKRRILPSPASPASPFPSKILQNILSRLDVKTLLRFKLVSKPWLSLISSPDFYDSHSSESQKKLHLLLRSTISHDNDSGYSYQFYSAKFNGTANSVHTTTFTAMVDGAIKLVLPSCRGLVCFATESRVYVYNPATLRLLTLPFFSPNSGTRVCGFGFGYVGASKSYKVVRFFYRKYSKKIECSVLKFQFGAKDSEVVWEVLEQACPYFVQEFSRPAFVSDTIYWKIDWYQNRMQNRCPSPSHNNHNILSFNIEDDNFAVIPNPSDWKYRQESEPYKWTQLVNLDNMLCMVQISAANAQIWMRRDQEWQKGGVIDFEGLGPTLIGAAVCIKDGEIIFSSHHNLVFYNIRTRRFRRVQISSNANAHDLVTYWESLFLLGDSHHP